MLDMLRTIVALVAAPLLVLTACGQEEPATDAPDEETVEQASENAIPGFGEQFEIADGILMAIEEPEEWTLEEALDQDDLTACSDEDGNDRKCTWEDYTYEEVDPEATPVKFVVTYTNPGDKPVTDLWVDAMLLSDGEFVQDAGGSAEIAYLKPIAPGATVETLATFLAPKWDADSVVLAVDVAGEYIYVGNDPSLVGE